jgi:hypothetical protein
VLLAVQVPRPDDSIKNTRSGDFRVRYGGKAWSSKNPTLTPLLLTAVFSGAAAAMHTELRETRWNFGAVKCACLRTACLECSRHSFSCEHKAWDDMVPLLQEKIPKL